MGKELTKRFLPIIIILILILMVYLTGLTDYLSWKNFENAKRTSLDFVKDHPILTPLIFIGIYIVYTSLSLPGASILTILAGSIFPQPFSTLYVVFGATIGASILFLSARSAIGDLLYKKAGPWLNKMKNGFQKNAVSYLLFLRFTPLFPFWLVNIAPAFFGVSFFTFLWTTLVGIIPGSIVFTQIGAGLMDIMDENEPISIHTVFNTQIKIALFGLAIIALLPIVLKKVTHFENDNQNNF